MDGNTSSQHTQTVGYIVRWTATEAAVSPGDFGRFLGLVDQDLVKHMIPTPSPKAALTRALAQFESRRLGRKVERLEDGGFALLVRSMERDSYASVGIVRLSDAGDVEYDGQTFLPSINADGTLEADTPIRDLLTDWYNLASSTYSARDVRIIIGNILDSLDAVPIFGTASTIRFVLPDRFTTIEKMKEVYRNYGYSKDKIGFEIQSFGVSKNDEQDMVSEVERSLEDEYNELVGAAQRSLAVVESGRRNDKNLQNRIDELAKIQAKTSSMARAFAVRSKKLQEIMDSAADMINKLIAA